MRNLLYLIANAPWWWYAVFCIASLLLGIAGLACDRPEVAEFSFLLAALYAPLAWLDYRQIIRQEKDQS